MYGETLRRLGKAQWRLGKQPFGEWLPGRFEVGNAVTSVVLPFSEIYRYTLHSKHDYPLHSNNLQKNGPTRLLVYPASFAEKAVRDATSANYHAAQKALDAGDIPVALEKLTEELRAKPNNFAIALDLLDLCKVANKPLVAKRTASSRWRGERKSPNCCCFTRLAGQIRSVGSPGLLQESRPGQLRADGNLPEARQTAQCHRANSPRGVLLPPPLPGADDQQRNEIRRLLGMPEERMFKK